MVVRISKEELEQYKHFMARWYIKMTMKTKEEYQQDMSEMSLGQILTEMTERDRAFWNTRITNFYDKAVRRV